MISKFKIKETKVATKKASVVKVKPKKVRKEKSKMYSNNIKKILDEIGMNQTQLAERVGTNKAHISKIIKGERPSLSLPVGLKIAQILGKRVEEVFTLER